MNLSTPTTNTNWQIFMIMYVCAEMQFTFSESRTDFVRRLA